MSKPVDILFIVPGTRWDTWRHAIKHILWVLESEKTFDVMSADEFVRLYSDMPVEEIDAALKLQCVALTNTSDISKREWKTFKPLRQKLYDFWELKNKEIDHEETIVDE